MYQPMHLLELDIIVRDHDIETGIRGHVDIEGASVRHRIEHVNDDTFFHSLYTLLI
jgi:hypothetical protein